MPDKMYLLVYLYSVLKKVDNNLSWNWKLETLFKYPPGAMLAEISAKSKELLGMLNAVPPNCCPLLENTESPRVDLNV